MKDNEHSGEALLRELAKDSAKFRKDGRSYELLLAYFDGLPVETLRPLIRSDDLEIVRVGMFIASELGNQRACSLVDDVILLLGSTDDRYVKYHAMEILILCSDGSREDDFWHVLKQLDSEDTVLRGLAMRLTVNAKDSQLAAARGRFDSNDRRDQVHCEGLSLLLDPEVKAVGVLALIKSEEGLLRRYGAVASKRMSRAFDSLLDEVRDSPDPDLQRFHRMVTS